MGTKDSKAKEYLSDNTRFSEICNYVLFDGEKVIKPEDLKECDTTEVLSVFGIDKKQIVKQKWRDLLKGVSVKYTESVYIVLMGIEAQTDVHYSMPVKTMIYDAMNYGEQVNEAKKQHQKNKDYKSSDEFLSGFTHEDRLTPVITITLYLGTTHGSRFINGDDSKDGLGGSYVMVALIITGATSVGDCKRFLPSEPITCFHFPPTLKKHSPYFSLTVPSGATSSLSL